MNHGVVLLDAVEFDQIPEFAGFMREPIRQPSSDELFVVWRRQHREII
jgi:hypothetical protein